MSVDTGIFWVFALERNKSWHFYLVLLWYLYCYILTIWPIPIQLLLFVMYFNTFVYGIIYHWYSTLICYSVGNGHLCGNRSLLLPWFGTHYLHMRRSWPPSWTVLPQSFLLHACQLGVLTMEDGFRSLMSFYVQILSQSLCPYRHFLSLRIPSSL